MIFGSEDDLPVCGFLKTHIMMVTNMKDYVLLDPDDDVDFRYGYIDTRIAQFKQDLYNQSFSLQDQGEGDRIDTLQNKIKFWLNIIDMGMQYLIIPKNVIITTKDWIILFAVQRYFPIVENLKNYWIFSGINDSESNQSLYKRNLLQTTQKELVHKQNRHLLHS